MHATKGIKASSIMSRSLMFSLSFMVIAPDECHVVRYRLASASPTARTDLHTMSMESFKAILKTDAVVRDRVLVKDNVVVDFVRFTYLHTCINTIIHAVR